MKKVEFVKDGTITTYRIEEAFMTKGFRILIDYENSTRKTSDVWIDKDGDSDRVFNTKEEAEIAVFEYTNKLLKIGAIEKFVVS